MYFLYLVWNEEGYVINISPDPDLDLAYWADRSGYTDMLVLEPALPVGTAVRVLQETAAAPEEAGTAAECAGFWCGSKRGPAGDGFGFWWERRRAFSGVDKDCRRERRGETGDGDRSWWHRRIATSGDAGWWNKWNPWRACTGFRGNGHRDNPGLDSRGLEAVVRKKAKQLSDRTRRLGWQIPLTQHRRGLRSAGGARPVGKDGSLCLDPSWESEIISALEGRILFRFEIEKVLAEHGCPVPPDLDRKLQLLYLRGECLLLPAVGYDRRGRPVCHRCGQSGAIAAVDCAACGQHMCLQCGDCRQMGESRLCRPLYAFPKRQVELRTFESRTFSEMAAAAGASGNRGDGKQAAASLTTASQATASQATASEATALEAAASAGVFPAQQGGSDRLPGGGFQPEFALAPAQKDAAAFLRDFVRHGPADGECLVWAVCGAGKTEVSWAAMEEVLAAGGRVMLAVPRRDVVIDLEPRFKKAYPGLPVVALYGGSPAKYRDARVVLATTHQAIRFYQAFALVVLDEVDAFPFHRNPMLYYAVRRARQPGGKVIYMSATPDQELVRRVERGEAACVRIPARHHGYPLPEPQLLVERELVVGADREQLKVPESVRHLLRRDPGFSPAPLLVFVPTVALAEKVGKALQKLPELRGLVEYSHARDAGRDQKRERFLRGEFPIFVTTTIMERGITVPGTDVLVLFADYDRIFDAATLIQIAGRCGRTGDRPFGQISFVGRKINQPMQEALAQIRRMNAEAYQRGYLYRWFPDRETKAAASGRKGWWGS